MTEERHLLHSLPRRTWAFWGRREKEPALEHLECSHSNIPIQPFSVPGSGSWTSVLPIWGDAEMKHSSRDHGALNLWSDFRTSGFSNHDPPHSQALGRDHTCVSSSRKVPGRWPQPSQLLLDAFCLWPQECSLQSREALLGRLLNSPRGPVIHPALLDFSSTLSVYTARGGERVLSGGVMG